MSYLVNINIHSLLGHFKLTPQSNRLNVMVTVLPSRPKTLHYYQPVSRDAADVGPSMHTCTTRGHCTPPYTNWHVQKGITRGGMQKISATYQCLWPIPTILIAISKHSGCGIIPRSSFNLWKSVALRIKTF